ncbi:MAG: aminotransferase class I/II-fold pyridoxal phosphate-dependent enzyme, partial [Epsilonproteobacteria bacterium]|nr:aminotransferase class I/II-fold pyridoxal phosphate-dependent enzyme [Campylobacterota bacterium]
MFMIPYGKQYIDEDDINAVVEVLKSDYLTTGPKVEEFENALAKKFGAKYALTLSSGTAALHIASLSILKPNDLVLTTPNSFVATSNAIIYAGAKPLFVDIKEDGNIDLDKCIDILYRFSNRIKAIYAVHFSGNPVDMDTLKYIKKRFNITVLEDAAHALGATYECKEGSGIIGDCGCSDVTTFSFHPVKNITTAEGGAILTNNYNIYKQAKLLRNHGIDKKHFFNANLAFDEKGNQNPWYYEMHALGYNYRMSDIQAA